MTERRDTLRHILQWVESRYSQGESELDHVIQARNNLLDAELDIAKTNAERVGIREQQVNNYRDLENVLTQRHKNGEMVSVEILVVKAVRLKAEIQLLRE